MTDLLARPVAPEPEATPTPIDEWLRRQQDLSAVDRFARHDHGTDRPDRHRWSDRLPATPPTPGTQYAFEVDLDACTGCKACVAACHSLNGLDDGEQWRRVGTLVPVLPTASDVGLPPAGGPITVTSSCHHCVDPACLAGCPARAYEKDPVTGIVRHLDDACIGCSYCTLTCPYEVPTFNQALGIVRKCDLCSDRLAVGEAPACVQGCPQGAITIALVETEVLRERLRPPVAPDAPARLVPSAPVSSLTVPTTRYRSGRPLPTDWTAADRSSVHPSHGHGPLAVMLTLTQVAVGAAVAARLLATSSGPARTEGSLAVVTIATALVALGASVLHLGRPMLAWRAILGLRRSWLSREIVVFGAFAGAGLAHPVLIAAGAPGAVTTLAAWAVVTTGLAGVGCSAMLYAVTGRRWWRLLVTSARFAATVVAGGALTAAVVLQASTPGPRDPRLAPLLVASIVGVTASVVVPLVPLLPRRGLAWELSATAALLRSPLRARHLFRLGAGLLSAAIVACVLVTAPSPQGSATTVAALVVALVIAVIGEHQERVLFFRASVAPRMPGAPS